MGGLEALILVVLVGLSLATAYCKGDDSRDQTFRKYSVQPARAAKALALSTTESNATLFGTRSGGLHTTIGGGAALSRVPSKEKSGSKGERSQKRAHHHHEQASKGHTTHSSPTAGHSPAAHPTSGHSLARASSQAHDQNHRTPSTLASANTVARSDGTTGASTVSAVSAAEPSNSGGKQSGSARSQHEQSAGTASKRHP